VKKVYLCGGLVTRWQEAVIHAIEESGDIEVIFYNPDAQAIGAFDRPPLSIYSPIDDLKIRECDVIFAYLEASNPTPINIALELGYGKGLGKTTILCDEWTEARFKAKELKTLATTQEEVYATWYKHHYLDLLRTWVDFLEPDFGVAIEILRRILTYD